MKEEVVDRLAHESGVVDWFNSDSLDWLTYASAFRKFAYLLQKQWIEDQSKKQEPQNSHKPVANKQTFIRMAQLATTPKQDGRLPLHPNTIWKQVREGTFPAPVKIGSNSTAWRLSDIEAWEDSKLPEVKT